jgi:hypothetical protein
VLEHELKRSFEEKKNCESTTLRVE